MEGKDNIRDLFSEKLSNFETPVRSELWSGIASQIAAAPVAASGGITLFSKIIIGISTAASLTVATYFIVNDSDEVQKDVKNNEQLVKNASTEKITTSDNENTFTSVPGKNTDERTIIQNNSPIEIDSQKTGPEDLKTVNDVIQEEIVKETPLNKEEFIENKNENKEGNKAVTGVSEENKEGQNVKKDDIAAEERKIEKSDLDLYLPNVITPNNDGTNDFLFIKSEGLTDFNLVILDRNNRIVYQTSDPDFEWNGYGMNNEMVENGNYIYYLTARDKQGKTVSKYNTLFVETKR